MAEYRATAEPRSWTGDVPVYCAYDALVDTATITGNPKNPNTHPEGQIKLLAKIIRSTGWRNNITISTRSGFVVKGHGRLLAARLEGIPQCPVEYQDYSSEAEEWADLTADNRLAELAETDEPKLAELLEELKQEDFPMELTGYTDEDLESILDSIAGEDPDPGPVDTPYEQPSPPMTKPGDLWIMGGHRLLCGDATKEMDVKRLMDGEKAHMVHTDPPYGVDYETLTGAFEGVLNDNKRAEDLVFQLLVPAFRLYRKYTIEDAAFYIWHASNTRRDFEDAMAAVDLEERQQLIWVKGRNVPGHADYIWAHEPCFYASRLGVKPRFFGDAAQRTVWHVTSQGEEQAATSLGRGVLLVDGHDSLCILDHPPKGTRVRRIMMREGKPLEITQLDGDGTVWEVDKDVAIYHPTQKPVELARRAIENSTQPGELVLDFFGGSGSTLLAADQTERRCFTMELDPAYCDVILSRWAVQSYRTDAVCIRDGKQIPYREMVYRWAEENGRMDELEGVAVPVVVVKKTGPGRPKKKKG